MKHLKRFNESANEEDIKDILLELEDDGFYFYNTKDPLLNYVENDCINIVIKKVSNEPHDGGYFGENKVFYWSDIKDVCLRLKDYLGDNFVDFGYATDYSSYYRRREENIPLDENTEIDGYLNNIYITYRKT